MEQSIALYDPQKHRPDYLSPCRTPSRDEPFLCILEPVASGLSGPSPAEDYEASPCARELSHPFSLAFALSLCWYWLHQHLPGCTDSPRAGRGTDDALSRARVSVLVGTRELSGKAGCGSAGTRKEGIAQMHKGLAALRATGAELGQVVPLALLAEVYGIGGQAEEGLAVVTEALAASGEN